VGGVGAVAGLIQQSFNLLDRIQMAMNRQKHNAMHLTVVTGDVEGTRNIVQRIKDNPILQQEHLVAAAKQLKNVLTQLDSLVTEQESKSSGSSGFRNFSHNFVKGPEEQRKLEELRAHLVDAKNTLALALLAELSPSGTSLVVKNATSHGTSYMQTEKIANNPSDRDADHKHIENAHSYDGSTMMHAMVTPEQHQTLLDDSHKKFRLQQLTDLMKDQSLPPDMKTLILQQILDVGQNQPRH
jgi:hypothetical protein